MTKQVNLSVNGLLGAFGALIHKSGGEIMLTQEELLFAGSGRFEPSMDDEGNLIIKMIRLGESGDMQKAGMVK